MPRPAAKTLPQYLALRREWLAAGVNQADLAAAMGLPEGTLSRYLTGKRPAPASLEARIRQAIPHAVKARRQALRDQARALGAGLQEMGS